MTHLQRLSLAALFLFACAATSGAQCVVWGTESPLAYIEFPHPQANLFPYGGWTLYPGEVGSNVSVHSPYSHVNGVPPALAAQMVLAKLHELGVPRNAPPTQFLNRNPAAANNVQLPTPKSWLPPEEKPDPFALPETEPPPLSPKAKDANNQPGKGNNNKPDDPDENKLKKGKNNVKPEQLDPGMLDNK